METLNLSRPLNRISGGKFVEVIKTEKWDDRKMQTVSRQESTDQHLSVVPFFCLKMTIDNS